TTCSVRLASSQPSLLKDVQVLLANFGIFCRIFRRREAGQRMPDYELIIDGQSRERFMTEVGFITEGKNAKYANWVTGKALKKTQRFVSRIAEITYVGKEAVFDTTQQDHNTVIFNGLVTGQCGEQTLPEYGACLLGSVNLT